MSGVTSEADLIMAGLCDDDTWRAFWLGYRQALNDATKP